MTLVGLVLIVLRFLFGVLSAFGVFGHLLSLLDLSGVLGISRGLKVIFFDLLLVLIGFGSFRIAGLVGNLVDVLLDLVLVVELPELLLQLSLLQGETADGDLIILVHRKVI